MTELAFILAGFLVGAVVGLTGVAGGSLMTPLLIFGFGIKPYMAIGTDLLFAAITKFSGSVHLARTRLIDWRVVGSLSLGSIPAALLTIYLLHRFGSTSAAVQRAMTLTLGIALLLTASATLYKALFGRGRSTPAADPTNPTAHAAHATPIHWALPIVLGAIIGSMVALTSVGAGAIGVTALMLLYLRLPLPRIIAADIAYAVPLTLVAGLGHASIGSVDWSMLGLLLLGSIPGILLGTRLMHKTPERLTRSLLSLLLAYAGVKLLMA